MPGIFSCSAHGPCARRTLAEPIPLQRPRAHAGGDDQAGMAGGVCPLGKFQEGGSPILVQPGAIRVIKKGL
ncbi:MAG: hypothetical protein WC626_08860 [Methanoregula sp.]